MTLIELLIVTLVMSSVLVIAGTSLFSLQQSATRTDTLVTDEQEASTVLAQVSRDVRSAHQVTFAGFSTPTPTQGIELQMNQPTGAWVEWVYTPTAAIVNGVSQAANTLTRYVASAAAGPFQVSNPTITSPVKVVNVSTNPVFRYFQGNGSEITSIDSASSLQTCTTRVLVTLDVGTQKNIAAIATFQIGNDVAITDQETQWGTLPCS